MALLIGSPYNAHYFANGENTVAMAKQFRFDLSKWTFPARVNNFNIIEKGAFVHVKFNWYLA